MKGCCLFSSYVLNKVGLKSEHNNRMFNSMLCFLIVPYNTVEYCTFGAVEVVQYIYNGSF